MTQFIGPASSGGGANLTDAQWQKFIAAMFHDGIAWSVDNELAVTPGAGMQVAVNTGQALVRGLLYTNDASVNLSIAAADATNPRYDLVIVHADLSAHTGALQVLTGTPAGSPTPPALTQSSTVWEIQIAKILIPAASSSISAGNIFTGQGTQPKYMLPKGLFGYRDGSPAIGHDWQLAMTSNGTYMNPDLVKTGDANTPVKVYPLGFQAAAAAKAGLEWHLEGLHNGGGVDMLSAKSGVAGGPMTVKLGNMSIFSGTGPTTANHNLGQTPDIVLVIPTASGASAGRPYTSNYTSTTVAITIDAGVSWVAIAIKNS